MPSVSFNPHCGAFPMRTDEDHADAKQKQRLADMAMRIQALARGGLTRGGVARSTDVCAAPTAVPTQALAHGALSANRTMDSVVDGATYGASGGVVFLTLNRASQRGSCNEENSSSTCSRADAKVRGAVVERAARALLECTAAVARPLPPPPLLQPASHRRCVVMPSIAAVQFTITTPVYFFFGVS